MTLARDARSWGAHFAVTFGVGLVGAVIWETVAGPEGRLVPGIVVAAGYLIREVVDVLDSRLARRGPLPDWWAGLYARATGDSPPVVRAKLRSGRRRVRDHVFDAVAPVLALGALWLII